MQSHVITGIPQVRRISVPARGAVSSPGVASVSENFGDGLSLNALPNQASRQRLSSLAGLSESLMGAPAPGHAHEEPNTASTVNQLSPQELDRERRRYSHIYDSLRTGQPQTFRNSRGEQVTYALRANRDQGDYRNYTLQIGRNQVEVNLANRVDEATALGRISDYYSLQPEQLRGAVETIKVEMGANPRNSYWEKEYGMPGFQSAAVGGGGRITVFGGLPQLKERTFHHEFGHNIGNAVRIAQDRESRRAGTLSSDRALDRQTGDADSPNLPRGHSAARQADGRSVTSYGDRSIAEDFAEFYEEYLLAKGRGNNAVQQLKRNFPNRFALLEREVLSRRLSR